MRRYWQNVRALILARPLVTGLLGAFYGVGALLALTLEGNKRASLIAVMSAIPACGFFAFVTERSIQYAITGAALGIPRHAESLRETQILLIAVLVGVPAVLGMVVGGEVTYMALVAPAAAIGVLLVLYPGWTFAAWLGLAVGTRFSYSFGNALPGLSSAPVRLALILASAGVLTWWLKLPAKMAAQLDQDLLLVADRRHESRPETLRHTLGVKPEPVEGNQKALDSEVAIIATDLQIKGVTILVLSAGLGFDVRPRWRGILTMIVLGLFVLSVAHSTSNGPGPYTAYDGVTLFVCITLISRVESILRSCERRFTEEALLKLTPIWPQVRNLKLLILRLMLISQVGTWVAWLGVSLPLLLLDWVPSHHIVSCFVCVAAASCAANASLLLKLSSKFYREVSVPTILAMLFSACGAALFIFGGPLLHMPAFVGILIIIAIQGSCLLVFGLRALQFPVVKIVG